MVRKIVFSAVITVAISIATLFAVHSASAGGPTGNEPTANLQAPALATPTIVYNDDSAYAVTYNHWHGVSLYGGYRYADKANETASFTFTGTAVTWVTRKGTDEGIAQVLIDGVSHGNFDLYAVTFKENFKIVFSGLANKRHTIVIKALGTKNSLSQDILVAVNGFIVGGVTTSDTSTKVTYDSWKGYTSTNATDQHDRASSALGAYAYDYFDPNTTQVGWWTATGPTYGKAEVTVDGHSQGTVDLYSFSSTPFVFKSYATYPLPAGKPHWIRVTVLGAKNPASTGTQVLVDGFQGQEPGTP